MGRLHNCNGGVVKMEANCGLQNDAEHLPKFGFMADLFQYPFRLQAGIDECDLPNW